MRRLLFTGTAALMPVSAQAECLGQGCYDGLALLLGLVIAFAIGVLAMVILMFMRRWRAAKIVGLVLGGTLMIGLYFMY